MIRPSRALLLAVPCVAALALAPARARACSPLPPGLSGSIPKNGEAYPANAAVVFFGQEISLAAVTVSIIPPIGGPAPTLVPVDVPFPLGDIVARVDPLPPPGHSVEITGDFCPPEYMCEPQIITYVVTASDQTAPASPTGLSFDVYDYPDYTSDGGDCTVDSDLGYWVRAAGSPPVDGESPVVYAVTARKKGSPDAYVTRPYLVSDEAVTVLFRLLDQELAGAEPPEAFCFDMSAIDTALNAAPATEPVCLPCRYRVETEPMDPYPQPGEPMWTSADAYPGGPCKQGTGGGAGEGGSGGGGGHGGTGGGGGHGGAGANDDDQVVTGCGCELARPAPWASPSGLLAPLLLAAARLRRRDQPRGVSAR